jgi:C-methyltransferase.
LLTYFGLGNDIIDFIVDDNPLKHGKFTPGFHIPIMVVEELYKRMPDYLVVLSWNFAEPIMEKHKEYKNRGGKFILPMPKAHVVE